MSDRLLPTYFAVTMMDGSPAVAAEMPDGKTRIVAIMADSDLGHELCDNLVEAKMRGRVRI